MKNLQFIFLIIIMVAITSCQKNEVHNIVVIGGGLMGSSTAWQLSKAGLKVVLIEQQDSIYTFGSSFGEARISRSLGSKNDVFSHLQQTSVAEVQKLINALNKVAGKKVHTMEDIYTTSPVTYIYYNSQQAEVDQILKDQADQYEYASDSKEALEKFGMNISDSTMVIREYKKHSGTLNPKVLISKLHEGIKNNGGKIIYNEKVTNLTEHNGEYQVEMSNTVTGVKSTVSSKKIVSAAGPYTGELLKNIAPYFAQLITPKRLFLAFFNINKNRYNELSMEVKNRIRDYYPVANMNAEIFYSMIEKYDEDDTPILKVGGHFLRTDIEDLDKVWQIELTKSEIEWSRTQLIGYLNMLNIPLESMDLNYNKGYSCVYSLTESEIPYVTNIVDNDKKLIPNIVVLGGMSGIGAKGSLTYGLIAADILNNRTDTSYMYQKAREILNLNRSGQNLTLFKK